MGDLRLLKRLESWVSDGLVTFSGVFFKSPWILLRLVILERCLLLIGVWSNVSTHDFALRGLGGRFPLQTGKLHR